MTPASISPIMEDYLKAIYELSQAAPDGPVPAAALVERMAAAPATVTDTVKRLASLGLVNHAPYKGVTLTPAGEKAALEVIRHHRLLEQYLAEALGLPWDQVHAEADRLEHVLSEALEARIAAALGHPTMDPHGDPIPAADLTVVEGSRARLSDLPAGESATVARVADQAPAKLRYLATLGLVPGAAVAMVDKAPFAGPLLVQIGEQRQTIAHELAQTIFIEPTAAPRAWPDGGNGI
ncbi:MAG: metal-dependent transcriptional regulator [Chloroflexi bacterium]|nr:metal-dependent transcriptional regulator [Chloroflexota bacterium]